MRIYIEPVNPKLDYIINIICSIIAKLYLEVQLCTTSKVVNHINHIIMKNDTKCIIFTIHMESFPYYLLLCLTKMKLLMCIHVYVHYCICHIAMCIH